MVCDPAQLCSEATEIDGAKSAHPQTGARAARIGDGATEILRRSRYNDHGRLEVQNNTTHSKIDRTSDKKGMGKGRVGGGSCKLTTRMETKNHRERER